MLFRRMRYRVADLWSAAEAHLVHALSRRGCPISYELLCATRTSSIVVLKEFILTVAMMNYYVSTVFFRTQSSAKSISPMQHLEKGRSWVLSRKT